MLVLSKPGPPLPLLKAVVVAGALSLMVAAGVTMVPLLQYFAFAGLLVTAGLLFALFFVGRLRRNPLTTVLVLAFTLVPVAGLSEQALVGVLERDLRSRRARRCARQRRVGGLLSGPADAGGRMGRGSGPIPQWRAGSRCAAR